MLQIVRWLYGCMAVWRFIRSNFIQWFIIYYYYLLLSCCPNHVPFAACFTFRSRLWSPPQGGWSIFWRMVRLACHAASLNVEQVGAWPRKVTPTLNELPTWSWMRRLCSSEIWWSHCRLASFWQQADRMLDMGFEPQVRKMCTQANCRSYSWRLTFCNRLYW